jgi:hypothetical protein
MAELVPNQPAAPAMGTPYGITGHRPAVLAASSGSVYPALAEILYDHEIRSCLIYLREQQPAFVP